MDICSISVSPYVGYTVRHEKRIVQNMHLMYVNQYIIAQHFDVLYLTDKM